jgi:hypothetical protein
MRVVWYRYYYEKGKRVHVDRTVGGDCDYCAAYGDSHTGIERSKTTGGLFGLPDE